MPVDFTDKQILYVLNQNPRISYRALARHLDLSVTAVRNRVVKLEETVVIRRYFIFPSFAMMDAEFFVAILQIKHSPPSETFRNLLGAFPMIDHVNFLADGNVMCWGKYAGSKELDALTQFLYNLEPVSDVEFHTLLVERGKKYPLNSMHVQVLRCLRKDVRMPVSEISQSTGLTQRRVRKLLIDLIGSDGSADEYWFHEKGVGDYRTSQQCFHARVDCDVAEGGATRFFAYIMYNGGDEQRRHIVKMLTDEYPIEYYFSIASASAPVLFSMFLVEVANRSPNIINRIKEIDGVDSVKPIIYYAHHFYPGLFNRFWDQLFETSEATTPQYTHGTLKEK
ncbi:MAG: AsnC family transcriptional regulator [Candidatus Hermodarchaeota archaeon]|nr:AsnC family transcriptional regulator [Candidatus Hermodarchaeota archaeon]